MTNSIRWLIVLAIVLLLPIQSSAQTEAPKEIQVDKQNAHLLVASDNWAYWQTSELIKETESHARQQFVFHTYRQRIPEKIASLVEEAKGYHRDAVTIGPDGSLIVRDVRQIFWYRPDGTFEKSQKLGFNQQTHQIYSDGVMLKVRQTGSDQRGKPTLLSTHSFVPFNGTELDFENSKEIRSVTEPKFRHLEPIRYGKKLAWMTSNGLEVFDLDTAQRTSLPLDDKNESEFNLRSCYVTAFDGELVLLRGNVVLDASTGARVATNWDDKRISSLLLTHKGIGYRVTDGKLEAIDIKHPDQPAAFLSNLKHPFVTRTDTGLLVWTGDEWNTIPWYSRTRQ